MIPWASRPAPSTSPTATPRAGGFTILLTYDVFDAEGHFAEQVRIACPGDGKEDALFFAGPDRMVQITGIMDAVRAMFGGVETDGDVEPESMQVVCYQVNR